MSQRAVRMPESRPAVLLLPAAGTLLGGVTALGHRVCLFLSANRRLRPRLSSWWGCRTWRWIREVGQAALRESLRK